MANIKIGSEVSTKLALPTDLHWKVYGDLLTDLGFNDATKLDGTSAFLSDIRHSSLLKSVIRKRSALDLIDAIPSLEPRCMLELAEKSRDSEYLFFAHYQAGAFLKKFPFQVDGIDRKAEAMKKFYKAEAVCRDFNNENYKALLRLDSSHPDYFGIVEEIKNDIVKLLGERPNIDSVIGHAKHGPGVSLGGLYKGGKSTEFFKWRNLPYSVTQEALPMAKTAIASDPRWIGALDDWYRKEYAIPIGSPISMPDFWAAVLQVVDGNRIATVPKSAVTDRTIAIEPVLNVYLQLGVDFIIRSRLKARWGYNLNDQKLNQELARQAAEFNDFATIDLSMASDTISLRICELLLPPEWYDLLLTLRSPTGEFEGLKIPYEKLSSMGNGFTFAIESVIFAAVSRCAIRRTGAERSSAVYGDDIVVPTKAANLTIELLQLCGFSTNIDKTFVDGPFRESCGCDYYKGTNVRPLFLKRPIKNVQDLFFLHNSLRKLERESPWHWCLNFDLTCARILKYLPKQIREQCSGPAGESMDTYLHNPKRKLARDVNGSFHLAVTPTPRKQKGRAYFFRKLMNQLRKGRDDFDRATYFYWNTFREKPKDNSWDIARRLDSGNAFDVTKRGHVRLTYERVPVYH